MKFPTPQDLTRLANMVDAKLVGNTDQIAYGINEIHKVQAGDITFVDVEKYYKKALKSEASIILINKEVECPEGKALLICDEPFTAFNTIVQDQHIRFPASTRIHRTAQIGKESYLEPNVVVGENVVIGENCVIRANVTIYHDTIIGDNVIIQANCSIGGDAFYFKNRGTHFEKLLSSGRVLIEDNVEIGAGSTVDKGVSGDTIIGEHTKIDNLVQIGHGVEIGKRCLIASQVGIAGKTIIGNDVRIWGQVGITADVKIADNTVIMAGSGVNNSSKEGDVLFGAPAVGMKEWLTDYRTMKRLVREANKKKD